MKITIEFNFFPTLFFFFIIIVSALFFILDYCIYSGLGGMDIKTQFPALIFTHAFMIIVLISSTIVMMDSRQEKKA